MPLVSQTFDQLLDFTRTSAATFVGSDGLIQTTPASRNLLTWTQQFDNAGWLKTNTTIAANSTVAPDGTSTADTLTSSAGAGTHYMRQVATVTASTAYAFSFYVKAGTHNFIQLLNAGTTAAFANFDLANGVVGTAGTKSTASITSADNGWYRCTVVFDDTAALTNDFRINIVSSASAAYSQTWTTAGTETVFLWGAQLEAASAATTYTRNNGGVYPPRFDYDPVTLAAKGLLIEEQRVNIFTYSEQFDNAAWLKANVTITADATTSPDGTVDADLAVPNTTTGTKTVGYQNVAMTAVSYTMSFYAKPSGYDWVYLREDSSGSTRRAYFNVSTGEVGVVSAGLTASITSVGGGWYRCGITFTGAVGTFVAGIWVTNANNTPSLTGDGTSGVYVWGAQLEAGAFATSYIPTVASQVTRTADICTIVAPNFAPWYNQSEGSWVASFSPYAVAGGVIIQIGAATNADRFQLLNDNASQIAVQTSNVGQGTIDAGTLSAGATNNLAYAYRTNDTAASLNGGAAVADNTVALPVVDRLLIGSTVTPANFLNGHIRSIRYYPTRLTNAQLQALTA